MYIFKKIFKHIANIVRIIFEIFEESVAKSLATIVIEGGGDEEENGRTKRRVPGSSRTYDNTGCSIGIRHLLVG